jgi:alpha-2-macroglobulin
MRLLKQLVVLGLFLTLFACDAQKDKTADLEKTNKIGLTTDQTELTTDEATLTADKAELATDGTELTEGKAASATDEALIADKAELITDGTELTEDKAASATDEALIADKAELAADETELTEDKAASATDEALTADKAELITDGTELTEDKAASATDEVLTADKAELAADETELTEDKAASATDEALTADKAELITDETELTEDKAASATDEVLTGDKAELITDETELTEDKAASATDEALTGDKAVLTKDETDKAKHSSSNNSQSHNLYNPTPEFIEKYKGKTLKVVDSSEVILDGSSTLVVTFSIPVNPKLNFSNLVRLVDKQKGVVDGAWELSDNGLELKLRYLEPNRDLILTIDKMLSAINGSHLQFVYQKEIKTLDRQPFVDFASSGLLLPSKSMRGLPIKTLNIDKVDINFFKIKPEKLSDFISNFGLGNLLPFWRSNELNEYTDLVYSSRFDLNPKQNAQETVIVDLTKVSQLNQEGVYIAVMNQAGTYNRANPSTLFSISNIGVSLHRYENDKLVVMTHSLDSGKPLADINLSLLCTNNEGLVSSTCEVLSTTTDKDGYAEFIQDGESYSILTASNGQQTSFVNIERNALNLTDFNLSGKKFTKKQLFVFGPRDLYRPKETVYFNALLRDADGQPLPDQPIMVKVLSADGRTAKSFQLKSSNDTHGLYQQQFVIPDNAATGKWSIRFNLGDDNEHQWDFNVEEFLPERMAMEISTPSEGPILGDEDVTFGVKGWYLYGAPASRNDLKASIYMKKVDTVAGLNDFKIGSVTDDKLYHRLDSFDADLDKDGLLSIDVNKDNWAKLNSPIQIVLQASLLESGGRPVSRYATQTIWPASKLPAIRALFEESPYYDWYSDTYYKRPTVDVDGRAEFEIAYVDIDGKKQATSFLKARLVRERRDYYWTWSDDDGWRLNHNSSEFVVSEDSLSIDADGTTKIAYQPTDYGSYRVEVVDSHTNIVTSFRFWAGYDWEDNTHGTKSVRPDQVKLSIDKLAYRAGDVAKVNVQAPTAGSGYISLETNDGIIWKKAITVGEEGLDVDVPIEDWGRHDIYINAMIVRPSTDASVQTVKRAIGLLHLPIDTSDRHLNVSIQVPKQVLPESVVPVKIKMDKSSIQDGKKVTVLVSAVDSGVLNITNYVTPDPYESFLGRKRYDVDIFDVYGKLIEASGRNVNMSFGGDAIISGGKKPSNEVKIIAQQLQTIQLNAEGEGVVDLPLPVFNGELRIMAQAWDANRFGKAEEKMKVASPVIAELSTPRFLSGGDRSILTLDLHNLTDTKQNMQVDVSTTGLVHQSGPQTTFISLDSKQKDIVQIPIIADYGYGKGTVTVDIKGILIDDFDLNVNRSWSIGVRPAYAATTRSYSAVLDKDENWKLPDQALSGLIDNTIEGKLTVSNRPPLNISHYIKELFAYPYGCLEQTTSGLFPSLYANSEQLTRLGIKTESDEIRRKKVQTGISRILSMQRNNGSFGLWSNYSEEEHWLTVYATDFLLQAKERGYQVNDRALNAAISHIGQYIYDPSSLNNIHYYSDESALEFNKLSIKAYALMILAKQNKITSAMRNELYYLVDKVSADEAYLYSPLPVAQLAVAAKLNGYQAAYDKLLPLVFSTPYKYGNKWLGNYGSKIRDEALILSLLLENDIAKNNQGYYLVNLSELLNDKRYLSTQELNSLFIAGWSLEQHSGDNKFKVGINGKVNEAGPVFRSAYDYDGLTQGLSIDNSESDEPLYAKFSVTGYEQEPPKPTSSSSFFNISRSYYNLEGNKISPSSLDVGSMMVVVLEVTSQAPVNDALVVDFLPAGLELENQNLTNSSVNLSSIPSVADLLKGDDMSEIKHQEFRDDRYVAAVNIKQYAGYNTYRKRLVYLVRAVTPGDYVVPSPYVESMYNPDRFAIGRSLELMTISNPSKAQK